MPKFIFKTPEPCSVQAWAIGDTEAEAVANAIAWLSENGVGDFDRSDLIIREEM